MDITRIQEGIRYRNDDRFIMIAVGDENYAIAVNYLREVKAGLDLYGDYPPSRDGDWEEM